MDQVKQVTVADVTYNVAQASAVKQKKLLLLVGGKIVLHSAVSTEHQIDTALLKGALLTMPEQTLDEITAIVLWKCVQSGTMDPVTIENFQGGMNAFFDLIAKAIEVNLSDFFSWLESEHQNKKEKTKDQNPKTMESIGS